MLILLELDTVSKPPPLKKKLDAAVLDF